MKHACLTTLLAAPGLLLAGSAQAQSTGNVGIGTTSPTATLDVRGTLRVGSSAMLSVGQPNSPSGAARYTNPGQSFTLPAGAIVTGVEVYVYDSGPATFTLQQGAPGGPVLASQTVTYTSGYGLTTITLAAPVMVGAAGTYSFSTGLGTTFAAFNTASTSYAGGSAYSGTAPQSGDLKFAVYYTDPAATPPAGTLTVGASNVGVGTGSPSQKLEVAGQVYSSTGGFRFPDNSVQTTAVTMPAPQTLSLSGQTLGISGGNSVTLPTTPGDNLGNHTATQNLDLGANQLVGNGGSSGLTVGSTGRVGIGTATPAAPLDVQAGTALTGSNTGTETQLRLTRVGTSGFKWNSSAELAVGTYAMGINSQSQLDFRLGQNGNNLADQPVLTLRGDGRVGIGTTTPRGQLDVAGSSDIYLVNNPDNGINQNAYLPGYLYLAPNSGSTGTAYVQARVPNPTSSTNLALRLRTTNAGVLTDALAIAADGTLKASSLASSGTRPLTATADGTITPVFGGSMLDRLAQAQSGTTTVGSKSANSPNYFRQNLYNVYSFANPPSQLLVTVRAQNGQTGSDTFAVTTLSITRTGFSVNIVRVDDINSSLGSTYNWGQSLLLDWLAIP